MPPATRRTPTTSSDSPSSSPSPASSRRTANRAKELWISYFQDALGALLASDDDRVKAITEGEALEIALSARNIADAALDQTEQRFPGL